MSNLASSPAALDMEAAARAAATYYDDAAGNRISDLAGKIAWELQKMQSEGRARDVRNAAVLRVCGYVNTESGASAVTEFVGKLSGGRDS